MISRFECFGRCLELLHQRSNVISFEGTMRQSISVLRLRLASGIRSSTCSVLIKFIVIASPCVPYLTYCIDFQCSLALEEKVV